MSHALGMESTWQLQEAKNRLSELLDRAVTNGAQTITRRGKPVAVVISAQDYDRVKPRRRIADILRDCPAPGLKIAKLKDAPKDLAL